MKCKKICWTCKYARGKYTDSFYGTSICNCAYESLVRGHFDECIDNMPLMDGNDTCGNWSPNDYFADSDYSS